MHIMLRLDYNSQCKLGETTFAKALPMPTLQKLINVWPSRAAASGR